MKKILVVDDDSTARKILERMLSPEYRVESFENGEEALRYYLQHGADLVLTDLKMPRMDGMELLSRIRQITPEALVFVITGHSSIDNAVTAIKRGAYDYISKPFDPDEVLLRLKRALRERQLETRVRTLEMEKELHQSAPAILGNHPKMLALIELARKVARTHSNVLIMGETGVGKELIARLIHQCSPRRDNPFIPVNCGALTESLLESELFGHEKGAFTGAASRRIGYLELADGGSILLDEIGTTDNSFQVKLLRVLQDRIIYRVGSASATPVDIRVIASTNQDLEREAMEESFRSDLYYRLSVMCLRIPPLRERIEDVPLLAQHFVTKYQSINPRVESISDKGLAHLLAYDYPGNVRELENIVERGMILATGTTLEPEYLMLRSTGNTFSCEVQSPPRPALGEAEKEHILRVLQQCGGKKTETASRLGINKTTLWRKLRKYELENANP